MIINYNRLTNKKQGGNLTIDHDPARQDSERQYSQLFFNKAS